MSSNNSFNQSSKRKRDDISSDDSVHKNAQKTLKTDVSTDSHQEGIWNQILFFLKIENKILFFI